MSVAASRDVAVIVDLARLVAPCCGLPSQAPTDRDLRKFSGSSTAVANEVAVTAPTPGTDIRIWHASLQAGAGDELPSQLCRAQAHGPPRFKERKQDRGKSLLISQERADMGLETAALAGRHRRARMSSSARGSGWRARS